MANRKNRTERRVAYTSGAYGKLQARFVYADPDGSDEEIKGEWVNVGWAVARDLPMIPAGELKVLRLEYLEIEQ